MKYEELIKDLSVIMTKEELGRITEKDSAGENHLFLELHGMACKEAKRLINNTISMSRGEGMLELDHGYVNGTAIKEMILRTEFSSRVIEKKSPFYNPGLTIITLAA